MIIEKLSKMGTKDILGQSINIANIQINKSLGCIQTLYLQVSSLIPYPLHSKVSVVDTCINNFPIQFKCWSVLSL